MMGWGFVHMKKLNVGAGKDIREGWVNLDKTSDFGSQIVWDLNDLPTPFKPETFNYVLASHVLEDFVDCLPLMDELVRITKKGGVIEVVVPNETISWGCLTHKRAFNMSGLTNFSASREKYSLHNPKLEVITAKYVKTYENKISVLGRFYADMCVWIANKIGHKVFDNTFLKYAFPLVFINIKYGKK